ncbi:DUF6083 domain-containing protein [Streptomyces sp. NPDC001250]|uniref:DUF6083 domain-containing protein n=1 Tax=unclassified Streptomyces TaxID=2593676 RepID=UPI00331D03A4
MRPHPAHADRYWDGSPRTIPPRRFLQISANSPSRLLRAGQTGRCRHCGNRIDWYQRHDDRPIALHPTELLTTDVPEACRWHLSSGIAHPHDDDTGWCRIPHAALCPGSARPRTRSPRLDTLRRQLALHARRRIDAGTFTPHPTPPSHKPPAPTLLRPTRSPGSCSPATWATARSKPSAASPRPAPDTAAPTPSSTQHTPRDAGYCCPPPHHGQLTLPDTLMTVYDLSHLPYAQQLRWRAQRCPAHACAPTAADLALTVWKPFDPLLHTAHIHTRLPHPTARRHRQG